MAQIRAFQEFNPEVELILCFFHIASSFKKYLINTVHLKVELYTDIVVKDIFLISLGALNTNFELYRPTILAILQDLIAQSDDDIRPKLNRYYNYLCNTYFNENSRYPSKLWNYHKIIMTAIEHNDFSRCNNVAESQNSKADNPITIMHAVEN